MKRGDPLPSRVRRPAVAGMFYPAEPGALARHIDALLAAADPAPGPLPLALVVPHAGTIYSGPIAASAYARLLPHVSSIARVVAFGPVHRVAVRGAVVPAAEAWATPLGEVPIDSTLAGALMEAVPDLADDASAHRREHAVEVQLPFLQVMLGRFSFVPIAVGCHDYPTLESLGRGLARAVSAVRRSRRRAVARSW